MSPNAYDPCLHRKNKIKKWKSNLQNIGFIFWGQILLLVWRHFKYQYCYWNTRENLVLEGLYVMFWCFYVFYAIPEPYSGISVIFLHADMWKKHRGIQQFLFKRNKIAGKHSCFSLWDHVKCPAFGNCTLKKWYLCISELKTNLLTKSFCTSTIDERGS